MSANSDQRFQIENVGWDTGAPDYRPRCACGWSWQPGKWDDSLGSRSAAARFARSAHPTCRAPGSDRTDPARFVRQAHPAEVIGRGSDDVESTSERTTETPDSTGRRGPVSAAAGVRPPRHGRAR